MEAARQQTIDIYNQNSAAMAKKFRAFGARVEDIELTLGAAGNPARARVFEIGCGDGRDAKIITTKAAWYQGIDISEGMLEQAREYVPGADFVLGDAVTYAYPDNLDAVFAFASLLHLNREEVAIIFDKVLKALRPGGVFYLSLKEAEHYTRQMHQDEFGERLYYFYTRQLIQELTAGKYEAVKAWRTFFPQSGHADWLYFILRK